MKAELSEDWAKSLVTVNSSNTEITEVNDTPLTSQEWLHSVNGHKCDYGHEFQDYFPAPTGTSD